MTLDGLIPALSAVGNALLLVVAVYIYAALLRQIAARPSNAEPPPLRTFAFPEAMIAASLTLFFLLTLAGSSVQTTPRTLGTRDLVYSAIMTIGLLLALAGFLRLRRFDLNTSAGFSKIGFFRTAVTGGILMLAAYPLIFLADVVTQRLLRSAPQKQAIVELFTQSSTVEQRVLIIVLAVSLAPLAEEFIFRFFMYGVVRHYFGKVTAVLASALLFAAVHGHLPSFAPLFVLGGCFAIAYEWSGSILVPMMMHAIFNAVTLTALAFPERFQ
jgi:membrane protease YdiL (CAAX protease family)